MDDSLASFLLMLVVDEEAAALFRSKDPGKAAARQALIDGAVPTLSPEARLVLREHDINGIRTAINSTQFGHRAKEGARRKASAGKGRRGATGKSKAKADRVRSSKSKKR